MAKGAQSTFRVALEMLPLSASMWQATSTSFCCFSFDLHALHTSPSARSDI